jgi:HD superfamily phosphodiesterase
MQTASGRELAERRHAFLERFLAEFHAQWDFGDNP